MNVILAIEQNFWDNFFSKTALFSDFTDSVCIVKHIIRINKLGMSYTLINFSAPTIQLFITYKVKLRNMEPFALKKKDFEIEAT